MNFQHKHNYTKIEQEAEVIATDSSAEVEDAQTIPLSPLIAASPHWNVLISSRAEAGFTPLVAFCFTVNYILGTGFLTIPWAFVQSGLALSCILMFISGIISDMAKDYLLETMARAEAMLDSEMHWIPIMKKTTDKVLVSPARIKRKKRGGQRNGNIGNEDEDGEEAPNSNKDMKQQISFQEKKMDRSPQSRGGGTLSLPSTYQRQLVTIHAKPTEYIVRNRKFEVNTLCRVFLGKKGVLVFTLFISLYIFGLLWGKLRVHHSIV